MNLRQRHRADEARYAAPWAGEYRRYDLVKEFTVALGVMVLLTVGLAIAFSSPDRKAISLQEWSTNAPNDFVVTAVAELDGTSGTATYGAPYIDDPGAGQKLGPIPLQRWGGVREPVDTAATSSLTRWRRSPETPTSFRAVPIQRRRLRAATILGLRVRRRSG